MDKAEAEIELKQIVDQYHLLLLYICRLQYPDDKYWQDDLYCQIVYRIWLGLMRHPRPDSERAWVLRIAINTASTHTRLLRRQRRTVPLDDVDEPVATDTSEALEREALYNALDDLKARLSDPERELLKLYESDFSLAEIASQLATSANNIAARLFRIRQKLIKFNTDEQQHKPKH